MHLLTLLALIFTASSAQAAFTEADFTKLNATSSEQVCFSMLTQLAILNSEINKQFAENEKALVELSASTAKNNPKAKPYVPHGTLFMFNNKEAHSSLITRLNTMTETLGAGKNAADTAKVHEKFGSDTKSDLKNLSIEFYPKCQAEFVRFGESCKSSGKDKTKLSACFSKHIADSKTLKELGENASGQQELKRLTSKSK